MRQWIDLFEGMRAPQTMGILDLPFVTKQDVIVLLLSNCPPFEKYWMEHENIMTFNETYVSQFIFGYEIEYHPEGDGSSDDNWFPVTVFDVDPMEIDNTNRGVSDRLVDEYAALKTKAPMILVNKEAGQWVIAEGGHRIAAAKKSGDSSITAVDVSIFFDFDYASLRD